MQLHCSDIPRLCILIKVNENVFSLFDYGLRIPIVTTAIHLVGVVRALKKQTSRDKRGGLLDTNSLSTLLISMVIYRRPKPTL